MHIDNKVRSSVGDYASVILNGGNVDIAKFLRFQESHRKPACLSEHPPERNSL